MPAERLLDVSGLAPPEPLVAVLDVVFTLNPGEYLRVRHHREPFPLYAILDEHGFDHRTQHGGAVPFEIFIWRRGDEAARAALPTGAGT